MVPRWLADGVKRSVVWVVGLVLLAVAASMIAYGTALPPGPF
jgi:hypothetical protein